MVLRRRRSSSAVRHVVLAGAILCGDRLAPARAGAIDLGSGNVPLDVSGGAGASVSAVVAGAGARLVKSGEGTLVLGSVLNTSNTFDAGVSVSGGVLEFPGEANGAGGQPNAL